MDTQLARRVTELPFVAQRTLSRREEQVLELADSGLSNKTIALSLGISTSAVSSFLDRARKKDLGADSSRNASLSERLVRSHDRTASTARTPATPALSPTEEAVVELALAGLSNAAIARKRRCSVHTVSNQLSSAYRKLGITGRRELHAIRGASTSAHARAARRVG